MIDNKRRTFLKTAAMSGAVALVAGSGLLRPTRVLAASWPAAAFGATSVKATLKALFGSDVVAKSDKINVTASLQAENGASVPVAFSSTLGNVDAMAIIIHENVRPLATSVKIKGAANYYRANIKMAKTSKVEFVVRAGGKLYSATKKIKVTAGGCGG